MGDKLSEYNFVYQNIRSLRRNSDKLLAYVQSNNLKPLVIGLSEIWIYGNEIEDHGLDGYNLYADCKNDSRAGGAAVFVTDTLICKQLNWHFLTFNAVGVTFMLNSRPMCVICLYRLHHYSIQAFVDEFSKLLEDLPYVNLLVMGDFNIDFLNNTSSLDNLLISLSSNGLNILVSEPTRITNSSSTCIDNILYRFDERFFNAKSCSVLDLQISDHCLVDMKISVSGPVLCIPAQRKGEVSRMDYNKLSELLMHEQWTDVYSCLDASSAFQKFLDSFSDHIDNCTVTYPMRGKSAKLKPWMTNGLLKLIRRRNKLCNLLKKHSNNQRLKLYSHKLCETVNLKVAACKKQYFAREFSNNGKDARKNWQTINEIMIGVSTPSTIKEITDQNGSTIHGAVNIANEFNDYFTHVGSSRVSTHQMSNSEKNRLVIDHYDITNSFVFSPITSGELYIIVNSLKNMSSPGLDGFSNCLIKRTACFLVDILSYIFNFSVNTGTFPNALKKAVVVPIFKKKDRSSLDNYRPISLLSVFSKIFEKAMKTRFVSFFDKYDFLSAVQYGFRKNCNTEQAIASFLDYASVNIDRGLKVSALFIDLTKAFDRVDHSTLLKKLKCSGFRGSIHKWFSSYLSGRTQAVKIDCQLSSWLSIDVGVPQGSVLGPLLFLVYVNGIFRQQFCGSLTAYADDLSFVYAGPSIHDNVSGIKIDLNALSTWLKAHNLLLSNKTVTMHFRDRTVSPPAIGYHEFGCDGLSSCHLGECFNINVVHVYRYLGILIDDGLNWQPHIDVLKSRLLLVSRKMYVLRSFCPQYLLRMVYFALADSILQYGLSCWGGACKTTLMPLFVRQKHIARIICFKEMRSPSWPIFQQLDILPLRHMFVFKVLRLFYIISGSTFVNHAGYDLRSNFQFLKVIPKYNTNLRRSFFNVIAPILFNNLPSDIRLCSTYSSFVKTLKLWLKQTEDVSQLFVECV